MGSPNVADLEEAWVGPPTATEPVLAAARVYVAEVQAYDTAGCGEPTCPALEVLPGWANSLSVGHGKLFVASGLGLRVYTPARAP